MYENQSKSSLYTYDVDVCFLAAFFGLARLTFPYAYQAYVGAMFPEVPSSLNILSASKRKRKSDKPKDQLLFSRRE